MAKSIERGVSASASDAAVNPAAAAAARRSARVSNMIVSSPGGALLQTDAQEQAGRRGGEVAKRLDGVETHVRVAVLEGSDQRRHSGVAAQLTERQGRMHAQVRIGIGQQFDEGRCNIDVR